MLTSNLDQSLLTAGSVAGSIPNELKTTTFPLLGSKTSSIPDLIYRFFLLVNKEGLGSINNPSFKEQILCGEGYHRFEHIDLNGEEAKEQIIYACAAAAIQKNKHNWLDSFGYKPISTNNFGLGLENQRSVLFDRKTGLKIVVYSKNDELLVTFGAFGSHASQFKKNEEKACNAMEKTISKEALSSLFGACPEMFIEADKFVMALANSSEFKGKKIKVTGQSLGGAIASYVSLRQQIPGIVLNSFPLGPGLQAQVGEVNLRKADGVLKQIIAKGDIFADCSPILGVLDDAINLLGFETSGNFGKKYHVQTIYEGKLDTHYYIIGSLFAKSFPEDLGLCKKMASRNKNESKKASLELSKRIAEKFNPSLGNTSYSTCGDKLNLSADLKAPLFASNELGVVPFSDQGPAIGEASSADLRLIFHVTDCFKWKKKLIETAEKSIEISANYAQGAAFRELLEVLELRMKQKPDLKVHLICAAEMLEDEDKKHLARISINLNFKFLVTKAELQGSWNGIKASENHIKLLIADEKYFVLGGSSITDSQTREVAPDKGSCSFLDKLLASSFRDTNLAGKGEVAKRMRIEFFKLFNIWEKKIKGNVEAIYFPVQSKKGDNEEFEQQDLGRKDLFKNVKVKFFVGGPERTDGNPITASYVDMINSSKKCIHIANSQFNPDDKILAALKQKKNKVSITGQFNGKVQKLLLVLPSRLKYDCFDEVYEYAKDETLYHKKIMVVDDQKFIIGSYNQSQKSARLDHEIALIVEDEEMTREVMKDLYEDHYNSELYKKSNTGFQSWIESTAGSLLNKAVSNLT